MPADCKTLQQQKPGVAMATGLSTETCSILSKYSDTLGSTVAELLNKSGGISTISTLDTDAVVSDAAGTCATSGSALVPAGDTGDPDHVFLRNNSGKFVRDDSGNFPLAGVEFPPKLSTDDAAAQDSRQNSLVGAGGNFARDTSGNFIQDNVSSELTSHGPRDASADSSRDTNGNEDSGVSTIGSAASGEVLRRRPLSGAGSGSGVASAASRENRLSTASTHSRNGNSSQRYVSVSISVSVLRRK